MISSNEYLGAEVLSHLNSAKGIIGHLEALTRAGDEDARRVLEDLGIKLSQFKFKGAPATGKNLNPESKPGLNYFAPKRNLQDLLAMEWFDKVSMDKKRFTVAWRNQLIEDLMASDCRDEVAEAWANKDLRLQVKGHVMGALSTAGVLKKSALAVARMYYGTGADNTKEAKTLAKYMGDSRKVYYTDWIVEYVNNSVDNPVRPIEN